MPSKLPKESEQHFVAAGRGKWSQPGVPHRGWECVDVEDLGKPDFVCEMCESQSIRYVHHMEHPNVPGGLKAGCDCAGYMGGDVAAAHAREASVRSRGGKRNRWLSRRWRVSIKGNHWIKADGYRVTVYERGDGWAWTIGTVDDSSVLHSRSKYRTEDRARLGAFDQITRFLAGEGQQRVLPPRV